MMDGHIKTKRILDLDRMPARSAGHLYSSPDPDRIFIFEPCNWFNVIVSLGRLNVTLVYNVRALLHSNSLSHNLT